MVYRLSLLVDALAHCRASFGLEDISRSPDVQFREAHWKGPRPSMDRAHLVIILHPDKIELIDVPSTLRDGVIYKEFDTLEGFLRFHMQDWVSRMSQAFAINKWQKIPAKGTWYDRLTGKSHGQRYLRFYDKHVTPVRKELKEQVDTYFASRDFIQFSKKFEKLAGGSGPWQFAGD